jgi:hypothetical protein
MATRDRFPPSSRVPLFVSDHAKEPEQSGKAWDAIVSSRIAKTIVSVFMAAAIVFTIVIVGNPIVLFVTASQVSTSAPRDKGHSMPAIQSTASAQALTPAAREAPRADELLAAFKTTFESKTVVDQPRAEALFDQFQAWAAEEDAPAQVRSPQPIQDARAQVAQKVRAQPLPKPRPVQAQQTARSQDPSVQNAPPWHGRTAF